VKRRTVCVYIDAELVEEAAKAAEAQGLPLSGLVEEALRLYVLYVLRRPEPRRTKKAGREKPAGKTQQGSPHRDDFPVSISLQGSAAAQGAPAPPPQDAAQLPPHLQNNAWIAVLRSRR
jgi:hypothetical protein